MKLLRLAFYAFLLPAIASAQAGYQPGYVVKLNGDTLKGFINLGKKSITPKTLDFKPSAESKTATRYEPAMLRGFEVTGTSKFTAYTGRVTMDKNKFPDVAATLDTTTAHATRFLRVAYQGMPLSVLEQQDELKLRIFIMEPGHVPAELIYYQFSDKNSGNGVREVELYKDSLQALAQKYNPGNSKVNRAISLTSFTLSNIISIAKQINNDHTKSKSTLNLNLFAGVAYNNIKAKMEGTTVFNGQSSSTGYPRLSIGLDLADKTYLKNFILRIEASYTAVKPRYTAKEVIGATQITNEYTYQFDRSLFTFTPQAIYNIINHKLISAFVGIGLNITYSTFSNEKLTRNGTAINEPYYFNKSWLLIPVQAGLTFNKKVDLFADYTLPTSNAKNETVTIRYTGLGVGAHYHFGR